MADNQDEVRVLQRQIQRLGAALSEARSEVENLRDELARVSAPAAKFGVILGTNSDGTVVIRTDIEKIKAETSRTIDIRSLRIGQEILLNDNECGVDSSDNAPTGQVVTVQEVLPGRRVRISDRPGRKEIVAGLSADLADATLITGQDLLYDETSGLVYDLSGPSFSEDSARQTISFDNIGGMSDHVNTIRHLLDLAVSPIDLLGQQGVVPPTTILLHGPSGCGKTLLAEASATYFGQLGVLAGVRPRILTLHGPEVISKYIDRSERIIELVFQRVLYNARAGVPSVVIMDDCDSLFHDRDPLTGDPTASTAMQVLLGLDSVKGIPGIFVVATTNRLDLLDPALFRANRIDSNIRIERPDLSAASEIMDIHFRHAALAIGARSGHKHADDDSSKRLAEHAAAAIYAESPETAYGEVTFADGVQQKLFLRDLASGALLAKIVMRSKRLALIRDLKQGKRQLKVSDVDQAISDEVSEIRQLTHILSWDDWDHISGKYGERITFFRTVAGVASQRFSRRPTPPEHN